VYQLINEPIAVVGIFDLGRFTPRRFKWRQRVHEVNEITFVSDTKDGGVPYRWYSIVSGQEVYRLRHQRQSDVWTLWELWVENGA
jgi:hypothetical protein